MKVTIYWTRQGRNPEIRRRICRQFGLGDYLSVNGETPADVPEEQIPLLREVERRGFVQLRYKP